MKREVVQLGSRGQLTLPAAIRRLLGLSSGDSLAVEIDDGRVVLEPVVVLKAERYSEERIAEFDEAADMTPDELSQARERWNG